MALMTNLKATHRFNSRLTGIPYEGGYMKIGIVGSRIMPQEHKHLIEEFVGSLREGTVVVSGGARGVDSWAADAARERGLEVIEHRPDIEDTAPKAEFIKAAFGRNMIIAKDSDIIFAFICKDGGGTEDTLDKMRRLKKPFFVRDVRLKKGWRKAKDE